MSKDFVHRRYYQFRGKDGALVKFTNTNQANQLINFKSEWKTNSPVITDHLENGDTKLVKTFEFESSEDQMQWKSVIDNLWNTGKPWNGNDLGTVEYLKVEWLDKNNVVQSSKTFLKTTY